MMLYLTGAATSLASSSEAPQTDPLKSLGGYISSSQVPNGALNTLFDLISLQTLKEKPIETIAIGLINRFDKNVKDVKIKVQTDKYNTASFKIACVAVGDNFCMEHINNRYEQPINAEFVDADFNRGAVEVEITQPGVAGEEIVFLDFDVTAEISEGTLDGTWNAIKKAFARSNDYEVKRLTSKTFRIVSKDDNVVSEPFVPEVVASDNAVLTFDGGFKNEKNNEAFVIETLEPNQAIGIWVQRDISNYEAPTNEQIVKDYDEGKVLDKVEEVALIINYDIDETNGNDDGDNDNEDNP